ncbi:WXG100 family type VII secretion target [Glycomyces arizonensis]|uniref:WXG100 family type VII secretion target n=1 Tax=Glycomyces arizonensis TaxID=256035 RepID=UPI00042A2EDB|nr:WXG100 family type VII secretion target [Glycomyces arizonensis]
MPTYEEALASDPAAFVDYASAMSAAGTDLTEHQTDYNSRVADINSGWQDRANAAFNEDVAVVNTHVGDVVLRAGEAAESLQSGGSQMVSQVERLKATDAAYRGAGFVVHSEPRVELGPVHWAAIAAAGSFGPMLQALFQARADEGTVRLQMGLVALTATDTVTGASLAMSAERLQPLEDKGGPGATICPPVVGEEERPGEDESEPNRGRGRDTGGSDDENDDKEEKDDEDEDREEDERERDEEDRDERGTDERPEDRSPEDSEPEEERPEEERPEEERPELETPEFPNSVPPSPPAYEADPSGLTTPDIPDYDSSWDPSELTGDEELSGGLAGGGGLGGGIGGGGGPLSADVPSGTGGGAGAGVGGLIGTPSGSASPTTPTGPGGRPGPGGMVGAPGSRGAVNPDDEYERESFLVEDPEEDVWGIGTDEDSPYADYRPPRDEASAAPAPPVDELPPFTLPGFDPPGPDRT